MSTLGIKIRKVRQLKDYSQEYVANLLKISQRAYSKIESGETKISDSRINEISKVLEVKPSKLCSFDESSIFENCMQPRQSDCCINQLPQKLVEQYEARIKGLEDEVTFFRKLLQKRK